MKTFAPPEYWDEKYRNVPPCPEKKELLFAEIFDALITDQKTVFEIGCYPGTFLTYLGKKHSLRVSGIDTTPKVCLLEQALIARDIAVDNIICGDFFNFETQLKYDIVCSFGFVEHFLDLDDTLTRHCTLVDKGGLLFVSTPNFRGIQWLFHYLFDRENLLCHVLDTMNLERWRRIIENHGFEFLRGGYYRTVDFWVENKKTSRLTRLLINKIINLSRIVDQHINFPSWFLSPYLYGVWKKCVEENTK